MDVNSDFKDYYNEMKNEEIEYKMEITTRLNKNLKENPELGRGMKAGNSKRIIDDVRIAMTMRKCLGFLSETAKALGTSQASLKKRLEKNKVLAEIYEDLRDKFVDLAEYELLRRVKRGDLEATKFFLRHQGKKRGYGDQSPDEANAPDVNIKITPAEGIDVKKLEQNIINAQVVEEKTEEKKDKK